MKKLLLLSLLSFSAFAIEVTRGLGATSLSGIPVTSTTGLPVLNGGSVKESRFHDAAVTNINDSGGAYVEVGGTTVLANTIIGVHVTTTIGEPLQFATTSAANCSSGISTLFKVNRGEGPLVLGVAIPTGNRLCVRSLTSSSVTSGEIVLNLAGA